MLFSNRRLCRHKHLYRTLNIPHSIASAYEYIDSVDLVYNEVDGTILVKPVRNAPSTQAAKATASVEEAKAETARKDINNTPQAHFSL